MTANEALEETLKHLQWAKDHMEYVLDKTPDAFTSRVMNIADAMGSINAAAFRIRLVKDETP